MGRGHYGAVGELDHCSAPIRTVEAYLIIVVLLLFFNWSTSIYF
uniref:Uncharacterized protein n=1 Tax=Pyramimonas orientalis virus TaxID=455367 RepID=A0A7M3UPD7_POV01|nr:hypothetical protein HWQ62_00491 [Pyramimonas orientalis virus]